MALDPKVIQSARKKKVENKGIENLAPAALTPATPLPPLRTGVEQKPGPDIKDPLAGETREQKRQRQLEKISATAAYNKKRGIGSESLNEMAAGLGQAGQISSTLGLTDLGRIDVTPSAASQESLANAQELAKGYSSQELAAQRSSALEATAKTAQAAERRLKAMQASQGIKGGAAASQQMGLLQQGIQARANVERDLLIGQFQAKLQGNQQLSSIQQNQDAVKREAEQFNLTQASREKMMPLQIAQSAQTADVIKQTGLAQAAATQAAGNSGGGITVICTELHRQGFLSDDLIDLDAKFGKAQSRRVMKGYHFLASPVVKLMKKSKLFTTLISMVALPWAKHMAHVMEPHREDSVVGEIVMSLGYPLCKFTGMILTKLGK